MTQASVNTPINTGSLNMLSLVCSYHFPTGSKHSTNFACLRTSLFARVKLRDQHHRVTMILHSPIMLTVFCAIQLFTHFVIASSEQGMLNTSLPYTPQRMIFPFVISRRRFSLVSKVFLKNNYFADTLEAKINLTRDNTQN